MSDLDTNTPAPDGSNSLWSKVVRVETDLSALRSDQQRTWDEISKLRAAVHPMATSLTTLTLLTERAEADRGRMIASFDGLSEQLAPMIATVARQGMRADNHIANCERLARERDDRDNERHHENQLAIAKMETRMRRVEIIYYLIGAAIIIVSVLFSAPGERILHHLLGPRP